MKPTSSAEEPGTLRYNVTFVRDPGPGLDVEVVLGRYAPREFLFTMPGRVDTVRAYSASGQVRELPVQEKGVSLPADTRFLRYHYALGASRRGRWWSFSGGLGQGEDWLLAGRSWLIRPRVARPDIQVEFSLQGVDAQLPWERGPGGIYRITAEDLVDSGVHGLGGRRCQAQLTDAVLDVAIVGKLSHVDDAQVCEWLRQTAEEVKKVRRNFPHPRVTIVVYPVPHTDDANVFGTVMWSSPPSVALLVGQDTTLPALSADWVALHEMLHLTHPAILPRTAWISEGLATYLTEVARARSGKQSPERSWHELLRGFQLGRRQAQGRTTQEMIDEDAPPGIYWVGAYLALRIDVELRRATGNARGLEDVLELLATQGSTATVDSYGAAVDAVAGRPVFRTLLQEELRRPAFAGLEGLLEELGVTPSPSGVKLHPARDSLLRDALDGQNAGSAQ
ncbi:hypothetical protein [Hyalangium versicolor]|uniref:hypothetical protein n=1 Tax=Hyalangium versicolor TaxID=2861190 RepID=UPI001CCD9E7A|nr:hypothetical protein [Hyalangium versicolor]